MSWTAASRSRSIGSFNHSTQRRMLSGLALPAMVVVIARFAVENWRASFARSTPLDFQNSTACRAAALTSSGSFSHRGKVAPVSRRAEKGPALMIPTSRFCK